MRWKTTVALVVLTVGIGAYISLYEIRQPSQEEHARLAKQVLDLPPETITQFVLDLPQTTVTLNRTGTTWVLSPQGFRADETHISQLVRHLSPLMAERVLTGSAAQPLNPQSFGLDPAVGWLSVVAQGKPTTLRFGETTPIGGNRYVMLDGRPEIFIIPSGLFDDANHPLEQFRDPHLLRADPWQAEDFSVRAAASSFILTRTDQTWRLTEPLADLADRSEVQALFNRLSGLTIKRFLDDAPQVEHLSTWGFDHPKAELTLREPGAPHPSITIFVGKPLADDPSLVYVKRSDEPSLYAVAAADVEPLLRDPHGLRATGCFELFTSQVTKLEVMREKTRWTIERTEDQWHEVGTAMSLDQQRVEAFLNAVADVRVAGFMEDAPSDLFRYGLEPPMGSITIWTLPGEAPQGLLIGGTIDGTMSRYGRIEGRTPIVRLPEVITELLGRTPDQLRPPAPPSPDATPSVPPATPQARPSSSQTQ